MKKGDVVLTNGFTAQGDGCSASFRPEKGKYAVFLLLGEADKRDPQSFDCDKALRDMGWFPNQEVSHD